MNKEYPPEEQERSSDSTWPGRYKYGQWVTIQRDTLQRGVLEQVGDALTVVESSHSLGQNRGNVNGI